MEDHRIGILKEIAEDMKKDAKHYEGRPFNGREVAQYFGKQGAAIAALANILSSIAGPILEEESPIQDKGIVLRNWHREPFGSSPIIRKEEKHDRKT